MASTYFTDYQTAVYASWLNDVNLATYTTLPAVSVVANAALPTATAASTYETIVHAASTYAPKATTLGGYNITDGVTKTLQTGSAIVPTGTTAQRDGVPATGYFRFNTSTNAFEGFNGGIWGSVGGGATGAGGDTVFVENSRIVTTSYTLTTGKNASVVGPLTINTGVTVTVPTGARLVVL
jgi:hypothetical protein